MAVRFDPRFDPFDPSLHDDDTDNDFSNVDYSDPLAFFKAIGAGPGSNLPMPKLISADEVRREARQRSTKIFEVWKLLRDILERHEGTIQKRWTKKTREQRRKVLLTAWPGMPVTHRPDFKAFRRESAQQRDAGTKFKDAFMWPHINQEDLLKPRILPLFINARGRTTPDAFAMYDYNAAHLGYASKALVPPFLNLHTIMFTGRKTPETYGELLAWDENEGAFDDMHTGRGMHPGQGLHILEMQQRILEFVVACCKEILHDIPADVLTSDSYAIQQEPPSLSLSESKAGFNSLSLMAAEAPYRLPASLDLSRVESLLSSKVSAAEDHIWTLREDPGYYADCVEEFKEHRQELLKDWNGQRHPLFKFRREETFWARVIGDVIVNAYVSLEFWSELHRQAGQLQDLQKKYADDISIERDLPQEFLDALLKFQHYLNQATKGPLGELKHCVVASPPMRQYYVREPPNDPTSTMIQVRSKGGITFDKIEGNVIWLLRTLWEDGYESFLIGLTNIVDELERILESEPKAKAMISSYIASVLSDLSVITECLRQLNIYQPWAQTFEHFLVDKKAAIEEEYATRTQPWARFLGVLEGPRHADLVRLGNPSDRKFYYPVDKRKTRENVESMRSAEDNLDAFWSTLDQNMKRKHGDLENSALRKLLVEPRILQRTPPWVEPVKSAQAHTANEETETLFRPLSELYLDHEPPTERTIEKSHGSMPRVKEKTRGVPKPAAQTEAVLPGPSPSALPDTQPRFPVDNRALKVFRALFYTASVSATPGDISWTDFLHGMASTGFVAEKLYGSVWQFSPSNLDVEQSIQFHEPHPSGKIPYRVARRHGRRLNRRYGWHGAMFVLAEKVIA